MNLEELINKYNTLNTELDKIREEILSQLPGWEAMANLGLLARAVFAYRDEHKCSFAEAARIVRQYRKDQKGRS